MIAYKLSRVNNIFGLEAVGVVVFLATNRTFPMLELSTQYASATTEAQKSILIAAARSMLSVGGSHTSGTFLGFFLGEVAGITISLVMLRGKIFSKVNAFVGILGFLLLLIFEICSSFVLGLSFIPMIFAMGGGLLSMAWYISLSRRFFQLGRL